MICYYQIIHCAIFYAHFKQNLVKPVFSSLSRTLVLTLPNLRYVLSIKYKIHITELHTKKGNFQRLKTAADSPRTALTLTVRHQT